MHKDNLATETRCEERTISTIEANHKEVATRGYSKEAKRENHSVSHPPPLLQYTNKSSKLMVWWTILELGAGTLHPYFGFESCDCVGILSVLATQKFTLSLKCKICIIFCAQSATLCKCSYKAQNMLFISISGLHTSSWIIPNAIQNNSFCKGLLKENC